MHPFAPPFPTILPSLGKTVSRGFEKGSIRLPKGAFCGNWRRSVPCGFNYLRINAFTPQTHRFKSRPGRKKPFHELTARRSLISRHKKVPICCRQSISTLPGRQCFHLDQAGSYRHKEGIGVDRTRLRALDALGVHRGALSAFSKKHSERLLEIRQSDECREFREWLSTIDDASDAEIRDRIYFSACAG